jgi:hypothetical protein
MKPNPRRLVVSSGLEAPASCRLTRSGRPKPATCRRPGLSAFRSSYQIFGLASLAIVSAGLLCAQVPWGYGPPPGGPTPNTPMAQRSAQTTVQSQVTWFQSSTRTASNYGGGGYGVVWQQFQMLQGAFNAFRATLTQQQLSWGANELAELDAGLGILQEAFTNYQQDVADGQSSTSAFNNMCQVLRQASGVWLQEFNSDCNRLRVGWQ